MIHNHYDTFRERCQKSNSIFLWNKLSIQKADYARVVYSNYLSDEEIAKSVVKSLIKYGFAFVEKVPPNIRSTEVVITRLFPVHKTFFGEMYEMKNEKIHSDTSYGRDYIGAHNDNTYFNDASGLQVFHCTNHSGSGGESLLLDGFNVFNDLKLKYPDVVDRLSEVNVPGEYIEEGQNHYYSAPIFRKNSITGDLEQVRFNIYDRAPFKTIPFEKVEHFYSDFRILCKEIQQPNNEWWFKLSPGTVLIFDNWRIMHGRAQFTGKRALCGGYVSRTAFLSKARTLGIID